MGFSRAMQSFFGLSDLPSDASPSTGTSASTDTKTEVGEQELSHINQEMYKKSAELAERNKALSLLQKINELILFAITNPEEVARKVVSLIITEIDFRCAAIYLYDKQKKSLVKLAVGKFGEANTTPDPNSPDIELAMTQIQNLVVQAVTERKLIYTESLDNVLTEPAKIDDLHSVFVSHLYVRNELIGAIVIGMRENKADLSDYRRLFLSQLSELVGIGIDNALLYNEVQISNQRLKELDKLKDEFVSVASHELRTPMTAIKSYLWMALDGKGGELNEKQRYYVQRGYNSVDRLIRLVNDMLNISRIESGRITVDIHALDIIKLTQEVVDEVLPRAQELGVNVTVQKPEVPLFVSADQDKIKEVLFNLIGNSLKFTPKDGSITVSFSQVDSFIQVTITDTGSGIEPEDISKLFQKFGLLAGSYTTNQVAMGTGLGLYICKAIISMHHGKIWAASGGRGKGATFSFTLQQASEKDAAVSPTEQEIKRADSVGLIHNQF